MTQVFAIARKSFVWAGQSFIACAPAGKHTQREIEHLKHARYSTFHVQNSFSVKFHACFMYITHDTCIVSGTRFMPRTECASWHNTVGFMHETLTAVKHACTCME